MARNFQNVDGSGGCDTGDAPPPFWTWWSESACLPCGCSELAAEPLFYLHTLPVFLDGCP